MTRFARAKGSKASNEKAPEDSTPWEVMKDQLLQAKKESEEASHRKKAEQQRIENYENFLKERRVEKRPATWCDFPETATSKQNGEQPAKKKKKNKSEILQNVANADEFTEKCKDKKNKNKDKVKKDNSMDNNLSNRDDSKGIPENNEAEQSLGKPNKKKKKKQKHALITEEPTLNNNEMNNFANGDSANTQKNFKKDKKTSNKNNQTSEVIDDHASDSKQVNNKSNVHNKEKAPKKKTKLINGKPVRRKEINDKSFQIIINGKEVELLRFDGFPVMKKDAERLAELKDSMIKKGIPKSEVQRTMKLERRRAEKALARIRREVCYNCRKGGHNLSDCPELKSKIPGVDAAEGVCFKCGSTEHRQFECKVQRDKEFRFATCFICKEPGHIARQCPDNPKGLYPNGGCCKLCGDVTHLRKDCPTANTKKEETSVKLQTLDSSENIEDIAASSKEVVADTSFKKPKKIKF